MNLGASRIRQHCGSTGVVSLTPMCTRALCAAACTLVLLVTHLSGATVADGPSAKQRISFAQIRLYDDLEMSFKEKGKRVGLISLDRDENDYYDLVIKRNRKEVARFRDVFDGGLISVEIGTVDLMRNGNEVVFLSVASGGTGAHSVELNLMCPRKRERIYVELLFSHNVTDVIPRVDISDNFHKRSLRQEREFLVQLMYDYGYVGEADILKQADNPEFAYYFWERDNGRIKDGIMTIRRFKGKSPMSASTTTQLHDGNILYTGYFKAGVEAYDKRTDEHFVVFHGDSMYDWPHGLKQIGPYLIIDIPEGLAVMNTKTHQLKRIPPVQKERWLKGLHTGSSVSPN